MTHYGGFTILTDDEIEAIAQGYFRQAYPSDCEILRREKRSEPDGIHFEANGRADDPIRLYQGMGSFFVHRGSGEIWLFSDDRHHTHEGLDYWLKRYAESWPLGEYRLTVRKVKSRHRCARVLVDHHVMEGARRFPCTPGRDISPILLRQIAKDIGLTVGELLKHS